MDVAKGRPFEYASVPIRVHENGGGFDADDIGGGVGDEAVSSAEEMSAPMVTPVNGVRQSASRTSELTISFEGEVYVFPAVTPDKVQAVLLLLGGLESPTSILSSDDLSQLNDKVELIRSVDDVNSSQPLMSRRTASLERFREKRKERCLEKKIRYTCRKEVAQRMHRKNGQFASVKDHCTAPDENRASGVTSSHPESVNAPGPEGPRTLCNACGLMWANKGTQRDLTRGGRHIFDENEREPLEIKPVASGLNNTDCSLDDKLARMRTPEQTQVALVDFGNHSVRPEQDLMEITEGAAYDSSVGIENLPGDLGEQETLDEVGNASETEFEIPTAFGEQVYTSREFTHAFSPS